MKDYEKKVKYRIELCDGEIIFKDFYVYYPIDKIIKNPIELSDGTIVPPQAFKKIRKV